MAIRFTRGWLALLLLRSAFLFKRRYTGNHRPDTVDWVTATYHPDHAGVFNIVDSPHRYAELWMARFDERDESEYLSAALMRAEIVKTREYVDKTQTEYTIQWDFSALWTVIDYLTVARMGNWGWLKYSTGDWPKIWTRELEILSGRELATV